MKPIDIIKNGKSGLTEEKKNILKEFLGKYDFKVDMNKVLDEWREENEAYR